MCSYSVIQFFEVLTTLTVQQLMQQPDITANAIRKAPRAYKPIYKTVELPRKACQACQ
jgi:hypothetical protein